MGRKILLVDDEPLLIRALQRLLTQRGFSVELARNGAEALLAIERTAFHLVFSDVRMPVMDGAALLAELQRRGASVPVVLLTGYGDRSDAELMALGAKEVLTKPAEVDKLLGAIQRYALPETAL